MWTQLLKASGPALPVLLVLIVQRDKVVGISNLVVTTLGRKPGGINVQLWD